MPAKRKSDAAASKEDLFASSESSTKIMKIEKEMHRRMISHMACKEPKPTIYLWLCCEGWMKFGPFEWLRFDDERQAILGPDGEEVAKKSDGCWRMPDGRGKGMQFSNPTITSSPTHPHRDCGAHPGRTR